MSKDLDVRFDYHRPDESKAVAHSNVRQSCKDLAYIIADIVPEGREKSLALTKLEEVMFWANAAIARDHD